MVTLLTVRQTAERLQVSDSTVRKMIAEHRIDPKFVYDVSATDRRIHPDYFVVNQPSNVVPFATALPNDAVDRIVDRALDRIVARLGRADIARRVAG